MTATVTPIRPFPPQPARRYPDMFTAIAAALFSRGISPSAIPQLYEGCAEAGTYEQRTRDAMTALTPPGEVLQRAYLADLAAPCLPA
jgi:hypothetical protein